MKTAFWKLFALSLMLGLVLTACKSTTTDSNYTPGEFTLVIAAGNNGEVGPCG